MDVTCLWQTVDPKAPLLLNAELPWPFRVVLDKEKGGQAAIP